MSEDLSFSGSLDPGNDDLHVWPEQFLSLPLFCDLRNAKPAMWGKALVLRIFKEAGQIICMQGAAGASAYFILNEADVYGLYAFIEKELQEAEKKSQDPAANHDADKLRTHVEKLQSYRDDYSAKVLFFRDTELTAKVKAGHEADAKLAKRCRAASKSKELPEARPLPETPLGQGCGQAHTCRKDRQRRPGIGAVASCVL